MGAMSKLVTRRAVLAGAVATLAGVAVPRAAQARQTRPAVKPHLTVYKDPNCSCCQGWINYMQGKGYRSTTMHVDLPPVKAQYHVALNLQSCHTTIVSGLVIEGHVPEEDIVRLLRERPSGVVGLTVPGMPASAPGMDLTPFQPYDVLTFDKSGRTTVWAKHTKPAR